MTEYYSCKKCTGLKIKTIDGWKEYHVNDICNHKYVYSKVERSIYKEKRRGKNESYRI